MMEEMLEKVPTFFAATAEAFQFLEKDYAYKRLRGSAQGRDDFRDTTAKMRYLGTRVGVEVVWSIADHAIQVIFIELLQPGVWSKSSSLYDIARAARAIDLYNLAEVLGKSDDPDFILKRTTRWSSKQMKMIRDSMPTILAGLARATQRYAGEILQGDTTLFPQVIEHYTAKHPLYH